MVLDLDPGVGDGPSFAVKKTVSVSEKFLTLCMFEE